MNKAKIPTLLAIFFLTAGLAAAVFFIQTKRNIRSYAFTYFSPKNIKVSNVSDTSISISWTTQEKTNGHIKWDSVNSLTYLNNLKNSQFAHSVIHYVRLDNLNPDTEYVFTIYSNDSEFLNEGVPWRIKTQTSHVNNISTNLIYGEAITEQSNSQNAIVYVTTRGADPLSTFSNESGSWSLNISEFVLSGSQDAVAIDNNTLLEIIFLYDNGKTSYVITHPQYAKPLPPVKSGKVYDLRKPLPSSNTKPPEAIIKS